jgi:signal transduction histidine kinase
MNKGSRIFFGVLSALILAISIGLNYFSWQYSLQPTVPATGQKMCLIDMLDMYALAIAKNMDPQAEMVTFEEGVPENIKEEVLDDIDSALREAYYELHDSINLQYKATYKKEVQESNWSASDDTLDMDYWYQLSNDENGPVHEASNELYWAADKSDLKYTFSGYGFAYIDETTTQTDDEDEQYSIFFDNIVKSVALPEGFSITFALPDVIADDGGYIAGLFYSSYQSMDWMAGILATIAGLLCLIVIFVPERYEQIGLLTYFTKWKAEVVWIAGAVGVTLIAMLAVMMQAAYATESAQWVENNLFVSDGYELIFAAGILSTILYEYTIVIAMYYVKHIFTQGFVRYLKEDTLCASILKWFSKKGEKMAQDIRLDVYKQQLYKIFAIILLVEFVILFFNAFLFNSDYTLLRSIGFALLLFIAADVFAFRLAYRSLEKIYEDYALTLQAASALGQGKYSQIQPEDAGLFSPIYDALLEGKPGIEKAVQEGIASQKMKTELITNVSHDLKTPLTGIKTYAELIEQAQDLSQSKDYAKTLNEYCDRLDRLVVDLFDLSKADSGAITLESMPLSLNDLVQQAVAEHESALQEKGLDVRCDIEEEKLIVELDPNRTMRIFDNLLGNIAKYALANTRVYVEVKKQDDEAVVTLKNISNYPLKIDNEKIKERFERGDASRHEAGSGLGLAIAQSFTSMQGGRFEISTDGDLFKSILIFPLKKEQ